MQDTNRRHSEARRATAGLIMGLALVAGISSVVQAEPPTVNRRATRDVTVTSADWTSWVSIGDYGDGTAGVYASVELGDGTHIYVEDQAATVFSVTNDLKPGQAMKTSFSGAATASVAGEHHDPVTGVRTPVTVTLVLGVTNTDELYASNSQGVYIYRDWNTNLMVAVREHWTGKQAYGEGGAMTVTMDGVPVFDSTGGFGSVGNWVSNAIIRD